MANETQKNHLDLSELSALYGNERKSAARPQMHYDGFMFRPGEYFDLPEDMEEGESWSDYHDERTLALIALWGAVGFVVIGLVGWAIWHFAGGN